MTTTQDLSFPNRGTKPYIERSSFDGKLMNLVPRIGFLRNVPQFPKGNIFFDLETGTLYYSIGTKWIPIANAASFMTETDIACSPDLIVVITPSDSISGATPNVGVALVPRGDGGVSLSSPNLLPGGGNCRGPSAVDLQIKRSTAAQIASGSRSSIGGGENNEASGSHSIVLGGMDNTAAGIRSLVAGENATVDVLHTNSMCFSCDSAAHTTTVANEFKVGLNAGAGRMTIDNLPVFADEAAAILGGLSTGMLYQTDGTAPNPLNVAGIMMTKL